MESTSPVGRGSGRAGIETTNPRLGGSLAPPRRVGSWPGLGWLRTWLGLLAGAIGVGGVIAPGRAASPAGAPGDEPAIEVARDGAGLRLVFEGVLEAAADARGPWTEVAGARSPLAYEPTGSRTFFRARRGDAGSIFASGTVTTLALEGPMQTHFDLAFAGLPDGIHPPRREKPYFNGTVSYAGFVLPVELRIRGNSSLQECPFPKLKLKVAKEDRAGTPFADAREIRIGTHCAEGGRGTIGRLRDQTATFREALAYEVMATLGFVAPRVRRAHVEYQDTSPPDAANPRGWRLDRDAFILEDIEVVGERLGGRAMDDAEIEKLGDAGFDVELITALRFLHALLGNWDYSLSLDGRGLWNTDVIALPDGQLLPVAGDFDLASWVTGVVRGSAPRDYHPELGDVEREARYRLDLIQREVRAEVFERARSRFVGRQAALQEAVVAADLDPEGRANALRHLAAFYDGLAWTAR